jgi:hypothetical protein
VTRARRMGSDQRFSLRWNNYQSHLVTAFESLLDEKDFIDVTLGVEGRKLPAHKMLLSACSPYFRELLKVNNFILSVKNAYSAFSPGQPLPTPNYYPEGYQV